MQDSDSMESDDFELLCSMSPKVDKLVKKRYTKRGHTILSLKKNFRRSSVYDHAKPTIKNESLVLIEPSSTDSSPTETPGKNKLNTNNSAIVISDTDVEATSASASSKSRGNSKGDCAKKSNSASVEAIFISERKKFDIESWIDSVTEVMTNDTNLSEISSIHGEHYNTDGPPQAISSTFIDSAYKRFDEIFKHRQLDYKEQINRISTKSGKDTVFDESFHLNLSNENEKQVDDICSNEILSRDDRRVVEIIDDSLTNIGDKNEVVIIEDSLCNISIKESFDINPNINEKNPINKINTQNNYSCKVTNNTEININRKSEIDNITVSFEDQLQETTKNNLELLNDSHIEAEIKPKTDVPEDSLCSENEVHSILDEIYGNSWRSNQDSILPQSERKPTSCSKGSILQRMPKTDQKPKKSSLYKNPQVQTETRKSNNLLKSLQKARMKAALESPWVSKLSSLCDPDSSLEEASENKLKPLKLDFESDCIKRSVSNTNEENNSWESSDESDKENLNNSSDWTPSLENRVKKKSNLQDTDKQTQCIKNNVKEPPKAKIKNKKIIKKKQDKLDKVSVSSDEESKTNRGYRTCKQLDTTHTFLASLSSNIPITECDMTARIFRSNFKKHRNELAKRLFNLFNDKVFDKALPENTEIKWNDRLRGTAGRCDCVKVTRRTGLIERTAKILLSSKVLDRPDRLRDTLIHEMCHAATWIVNQISDGHGHFWQHWAHKAMMTFPELPPIKRCHDYVINTKYTYRCTGCGYSIGRHSKSLDIERKRCGYCYGKFEVLLNRTSKKGELKSVPVTPKKEPTGFALFVKENYAVHKSHQLSHAEVMKLLGQKFAELKTD